MNVFCFSERSYDVRQLRAARRGSERDNVVCVRVWECVRVSAGAPRVAVTSRRGGRTFHFVTEAFYLTSRRVGVVDSVLLFNESV